MLRTAVAYAHGDGTVLSISHIFAIVDAELKEYMWMDRTMLAPDEQKRRERVRDALRSLERLCEGKPKS